MEDRTNAFDLSLEQQDTALRLNRLLGKAVADRYIDFCRLSAGAFALNVSLPIAAHALRELDSMLRQVLEVPMDARASLPPKMFPTLDRAKNALTALGFDKDTVRRAVESLKPRNSHKTQIRLIVARLGLDPDGDVAMRWADVSESAAPAHQRSFHRSLEVDAEFRTKYFEPFDTVIRAVAVALESCYARLVQRVEALAAMPDRAEAVKAFAKEIPGALPLQWHFFERLSTGDWLPHLERKGLLGEPLSDPGETDSAGSRFRQWPAGSYLRKMAESADPKSRAAVVDALKVVAASEHPDIRDAGVGIIAALPANESASLADVAGAWLGRGARFGTLQSADKLLKKLAEGGQCRAAQRLAQKLLQVWENNGRVENHFGLHMYEHHLPSIMSVLTKACGESALRLLINLLAQTGEITGRMRYDHHSSQPIDDDSMAGSDLYRALISAVRQSARMLVADNPANMRPVIGILTMGNAKIYSRLALHMLAQNPSAAPELAEAYLLNPEFIEESWCQHEYAALARVWFPSLSRRNQAAVLRIVDSIPDRHRAAWRLRFEEHHKHLPSTENEEAFTAHVLRDVLWRWRAVLPPDRQESLNRIIEEHGDPDAWAERLFPVEESPLDGSQFALSTVPEIVAFLKTWQPSAERQRQTVTALADELRVAVINDPKVFAAGADQFVDLKAIFVRRLMESLRTAANDQRDFPWTRVLVLIEWTYGQYVSEIDSATVAEGDDKHWWWACIAAGELLTAGLRRGSQGIGFEHASLVKSLVFAALGFAPTHPEVGEGEFEDRYRRDPFFAAQTTLRGIAIELSILLVFWLSKDLSTQIGTAPREALQNLPDVRGALEAQLADPFSDGRIPRAVIGRYLGMLFFFGEPWLRSQLFLLFPIEDESLRQAAWRGHLSHDQGPLQPLMAELRDSYASEIALLGAERDDGEFGKLYENRLAEYILLLHLWGGLPEDLLEQFCQAAPPRVRQYAMWFVGQQLSRSASEGGADVKARALAYWEYRLTEAMKSASPDSFRAELGGVGQWCSNQQVDGVWLCDQLLRMLDADFAPTDGFRIVEWLREVASSHVDLAVEVTSALLRHPRVDQWIFTTQREPIRAILSEGKARGTPATITRVQRLVSYLATLGETSYLDLSD